MIQIIAKNPVSDSEVIITYMQMGYSEYNPEFHTHAYRVTSEVEDSFVGASMFGWSAPVADDAHSWAGKW